VDLLEEIQAAQTTRRGAVCATCLWVDSLPESDQKQWAEALARPATEFTSASLHAVAKRHGADFGANSIERHRRMGHGR
jgi:hypothetical protein